MRRSLFRALSTPFLLAGLSLAATPLSAAAEPAKAVTQTPLAVGRKALDFTLPNQEGKLVQLKKSGSPHASVAK